MSEHEEGKTPQWHVTWSTKGRQPIAADEATRRALVRCIVERAGAVLVLFCVVDDHAHLWLICDEPTRRKLVRSLKYGIAGLASAPLQPAHVEPVETRSHSVSLIPYILTQLQHHGIDVYPSEWSGNCLPDLVGARAIEGWSSRLYDAVPRTRLSEIHRVVGLPASRILPASDEEVRAIGPEGIWRAASAAFAADPALDGRRPEVTRAVTAAAQLAKAVGLAPSALATARVRETISRAASRKPVPEAVRTLRLRIALDNAAQGCTVPFRPGHLVGGRDVDKRA